MDLELLVSSFFKSDSALSQESGVGALILVACNQVDRQNMLSDASFPQSEIHGILTRLHSEGFLERWAANTQGANVVGGFEYQVVSELPINGVKRACQARLETIRQRCSRIIGVAEGNPEEIVEAMRKIRESSRADHLALLKALVDGERALVSTLAQKLSISSQTVHARLNRLIKIGLVEKEEPEDGAHIFWIAESVSRDQRVAIAGMDSKDLSGPKGQSPSLPRLPEFDHEWPANIKEQWFDLYQLSLKVASPATG